MKSNVDRLLTEPAAVFFDLDDTLYDQLLPFRSALAALSAAGDAAGELPLFKLYTRFRHYSDLLWTPYTGGGMSLEEMRVERIRRALAEFGLAASEAECIRFQEAYQDAQYNVRLMPGAEQCLQELAAAGCLLGVMTNGPESHQARKLEALGVEAYIPRSRWVISGAVGIAKPDARLFAHANQVSGTLPAQACLVGDSWTNDIAGALDAGWFSVWFNYRGNGASDGKGPHLIVSDYSELAPLLLRSCGLVRQQKA